MDPELRPRRRPRTALVVVAVLVGACGGSQAPNGTSRTESRTISGSFPVVPVLVPQSGDGDQSAVLADGVVERGNWYCSDRPAPQHYEMMFADGEARAVGAVGFVPGNLGPDGVGPVEVRVQTGHGVTAPGQTFRARLHGRSGMLMVLELPAPVTGDHVLLTFLRRSPYSTASCLGEIVVFPEAGTAQSQGGAVFRATLYEPPADAGTPASEAPEPGDAGADVGTGGSDAGSDVARE